MRLGWLAACGCAAVVFFTSASPALAQPELGEGPLPAFELVSVLPGHPVNGPMISVTPGTGEFTARGISLKRLVGFAYDIEPSRVVGAPEWADSAYYRIDARVREDSSGADEHWTSDEIRPLVRGLLFDHFGLRAHREQAPVYVLETVPGAPGMPRSAGDGQRGEGIREDVRGAWTGTGVRLAELVGVLEEYLERPVLDRTGLVDRYDIALRWQPNRANPETLITALRRQLGLTLRSFPVEQLVIDRLHELPPELGSGHVFEPLSEAE